MEIDEGLGVKIIKKADDPLGVVRVSLGGGPQMGGYYCTYRGTKEEAIACLETALRAMRVVSKSLGDREPDISPDDGKRYA